MDQRVEEGLTADYGYIVKANSHGCENCSSEIVRSCVVRFFFSPSIIFHLMMMIKKLARSPYVLAKSRLLFFHMVVP